MAPSSAAHSGHKVHATPRKDREKDRQPFPQSSQPSPAPIKLASSSASTASVGVHSHSTSTSSLASSAAVLTPVITVDGVLRQHASAPDPKAAALDHVVAERNTLSAQNSQLWKLIEKQRAGYNQILKELERIRAERDSYKAKLAAISGAVEKSSSKSDHRTPKVSLAGSSSSGKHSNGSSAHATPSRGNSTEEYLGARTPQSLHSSRSLEPLSHPSNDATFQSNAPHVPATNTRPHSPPRPPPSSAPSNYGTPATTRITTRPSPSHLVLSERNDNHVQTAMSSASQPRQVQAYDDLSTPTNLPSTANPYTNGKTSSAFPPRKGSLAESTPVSSVPINNQPGTAAFAAPVPHNYIPTSQAPATQKEEDYGEQTPVPIPHSLPPHLRQSNTTPRATPHIVTTPTPSSNYPQQNTQTPTEPQLLSAISADSYLSRDSRITLPDEARQYIANMADSPMTSPSFNTFSSVPSASSVLKESDEKGEFLEMDDDDDDEDDGAEEEDDRMDPSVRSNGAKSALQSQEPLTPTTNSNFSRSGESLVEATPNHRRRDPSSRSDTEEFPVPPQSAVNSERQQTNAVYEGHPYPTHQLSVPQGPSPSKASSSTDQLPTNITHQSQESLNSARGGYNNQQLPGQPVSYGDMRQQLSSPSPSTQSKAAAFRALPLLSTDLPYTTIAVSHSFVRPNDRGKEVLSFIVTVNPGNGKPGWKVEKMYSDVLSLDQRIRSAVGKGVVKRIANLPEGKLWKDHAPARVDQRKAVLEQYLQSLIQLPIKSNDEVIAFFTCDIVKETKQPVMQVGHKEGYLTKRGKNFGGWKTRFFVLQGPVLEYYDCRGGQHLGSIQITGAQIARQHRTDKSAPTDEEKEYRHAFLIVEAKKGPGGNHPRHVLCAESDEERDAWVELLVRYYTGIYNEDLIFNQGPTLNPINSNSIAATQSPSQPRSSTSSNDTSTVTPSRKQPSRPSLATDDYMRSASPSRSVDQSPIDRYGPVGAPFDVRRGTDRAPGLPSSLPDSSPLSSVPPIQTDVHGIERANSELGHYPDLQEQQNPRSAQPRHHSPERHRPRDVFEGRQANNYSSTNLQSATLDRAPSPEKPIIDLNTRVKISGPMNGAPIPSGFKFGGKDPSSDGNSSADRREKAKSRSFWGFGKTGGGDRSQPTMIPRAVSGVPLADSLDVAEICGLPAIVFRCIQYLEAKKADQEEGIYRLNGSSAVIKGLRDRFNTECDVDLLATDEYLDPHAIAGLLKSFLRDLPDSILTRELHLRFLAVIGKDLMDAQERIRELSQLIAALPIANYTLLRALTAHLILIVQNAGVNKMTMRNVGIVFSPTLGIPAGVFSLMLGEFNRVFNVDQDNEIAGDEADDTKASEVMDPRRNSRQYTDNAADQYLGLTGRSLQKAAPASDDTQSDGDDLSVQDESGTDTAEGEITIDSSSSSSPEQDQDSASITISPPDTPVASKMSKASGVAASKGITYVASSPSFALQV
ncbi:hypothetical protein EST38_g1889 [Candolleomyces aberdarensis]|uniref:RhoGAP-domain-containing protein n=1 Tax=Candolleomyces aberdarensis TaxID=2316362 RepID=A0A4Q2DY64_9AGAR|nr:hypothetical protein EST38_g1889 [Candolleomyces aberdarensis]